MGLALLVAVGVHFLPVPAVAAHLFDTVLGFPAKLVFGFGGVAVAGGDVAGAAWLDGVGDGHTVDFLKGIDNVEDAVAMACAEVVDGEAAAAVDGLEGCDMTAGQVDDMDVVADAGSVMGGVVVAENTELGTLADGDLCDVWHEVVGDAVGVFSHEAAGVGSDGVEIAKEDDVPLGVGFLDVHHDLFEHALCPTVGVGTLPFRTVLGYGNLDGVAIDGRGRAENDVLAAVVTHDIEEHQCAADVVLIVFPGFLDGFADGLQSGKMDAGVEFVLVENLLESVAVAYVGLVKRYGFASQLFDAIERLERRVAEIVGDDNFVAGLAEFDQCVGTYKAGTSGDKYCAHWVQVCNGLWIREIRDDVFLFCFCKNTK